MASRTEQGGASRARGASKEAEKDDNVLDIDISDEINYEKDQALRAHIDALPEAERGEHVIRELRQVRKALRKIELHRQHLAAEVLLISAELSIDARELRQQLIQALKENGKLTDDLEKANRQAENRKEHHKDLLNEKNEALRAQKEAEVDYDHRSREHDAAETRV